MKTMLPKQIFKFFLCFLFIITLAGVAQANNEGKKKVSSEKSADLTTNEGEKKKEEQKSDSVKLVKTSNTNQSKYKKEDKDSDSILSFNFVFYLIYEFKFSDISDYPDSEKSSMIMPGESLINYNGKDYVNKWLTNNLDR